MDKIYNSIAEYVLVCFSHLRWNFVYQRPQHLMTRFAKHCRTFYVEEPVFCKEADHYKLAFQDDIGIVTPMVSEEETGKTIAARIQDLLKEFFLSQSISKYIFWYYTPMALSFTDDFEPSLVIYDCMDELSAFKFAPPELKQLEKEMFKKADLVFTGGHSLYENKKHQHHNIYPLPSSIDKEHFAGARKLNVDPGDQKEIPHPRFGYYGVIDERFDADLINKVAAEKHEWNFIFIGPVVKIEIADLPQRPNIYYLGAKDYDRLPFYVAGWDIAIIPFVKNQYTEFISPTKTPEYLAAGKPVISTSIKDVVSPYATNGLVGIADTADDFIELAKVILSNGMGKNWLEEVDEFLSRNSWDKTWTSMLELIKLTLDEKNNLRTLKKQYYV